MNKVVFIKKLFLERKTLLKCKATMKINLKKNSTVNKKFQKTTNFKSLWPMEILIKNFFGIVFYSVLKNNNQQTIASIEISTKTITIFSGFIK